MASNATENAELTVQSRCARLRGGSAIASSLSVKKAVYKVDGRSGAFITTTISPVSGKKHLKFGPLDAVLVGALVVGAMAAMRFLVAH